MMCAWVTLVMGVALEQRLMETPIEETVTDFETAEHGLSVVLTNAIEDQREIVDYIESDIKAAEDVFRKHIAMGKGRVVQQLTPALDIVKVRRFQAVRLLRLLESMRDREAGRVT